MSMETAPDRPQTYRDFGPMKSLSVDIDRSPDAFGMLHIFATGDNRRIGGVQLFVDEVARALKSGPEALLAAVFAECDRVKRKIFEEAAADGAAIVVEGERLRDGCLQELLASDVPLPPKVKMAMREPGEAPWVRTFDGSSLKIARKLADDPQLYFRMDAGHRMVPVADLVLTHLVAEKFAAAMRLMGKAAEGRQRVRKPVEVELTHDGLFLVVDGNSTAAVAACAGWSQIPAQVVEPKPKPDEEEAAAPSP